MLFIIHVYLIICLWAYDNFVATQLLKDDLLKANRSKTSVNLLSLMNLMLYLLSTTCAHPCYFSHTSVCSKVAQKIDEDTKEFPKD